MFRVSKFENPSQKRIQNLLIIFLMVQPLLDLNVFFLDQRFMFFGFTLPSLIRMVFIACLILYEIYDYFTSSRRIKRISKLWLILIPIFIGYLMLHHIVASRYYEPFQSLFPYSFKSDFMYLMKSLLPLVMIGLCYKYKVYRYLKQIVFCWVILIAGSIVVSNLLGVSLSSYTNLPIKGNIFSWFGNVYDKYSFMEIASKGFFRYANEISGILAVLSVYCSYYAFKDRSWVSVCLVILVELAMLMIGTKVALYSFIAIFIASFIVYLVYDIFLHKNRFNKVSILTLICVGLIYGVLFSVSPAQARSSSMSNVVEIADNGDKEKNPNSDKDKLLEHIQSPVVAINAGDDVNMLYQFIETTYPTKRIDPDFLLDTYPYNVDPEFWRYILTLPNDKTIDNRFVEANILGRVKSVNANPLEHLTGMGYSRMNALFPLEQDFFAHFYSIGFLGTLLFFGQYFIVFIFGVIVLLSRRIFKLKGREVMTYAALVIITGIAFYSGNIIDSLFTPLLVSLLISALIADYHEVSERW